MPNCLANLSNIASKSASYAIALTTRPALPLTLLMTVFCTASSVQDYFSPEISMAHMQPHLWVWPGFLRSVVTLVALYSCSSHKSVCQCDNAACDVRFRILVVLFHLYLTYHFSLCSHFLD